MQFLCKGAACHLPVRARWPSKQAVATLQLLPLRRKGAHVAKQGLLCTRVGSRHTGQAAAGGRLRGACLRRRQFRGLCRRSWSWQRHTYGTPVSLKCRAWRPPHLETRQAGATPAQHRACSGQAVGTRQLRAQPRIGRAKRIGDRLTNCKMHGGRRWGQCASEVTGAGGTSGRDGRPAGRDTSWAALKTGELFETANDDAKPPEFGEAQSAAKSSSARRCTARHYAPLPLAGATNS